MSADRSGEARKTIAACARAASFAAVPIPGRQHHGALQRVRVLRYLGSFFVAVVAGPLVQPARRHNARQRMNDTLLATVAKRRILASMPPQWIRRSRRIAAVSPDCQALCWVSIH